MSPLPPIPEQPPADLLAELDESARALDELTARRAELTLRIGADGLRIALTEGATQRSLSPTELFELLAGA
jgi:hypothetical protein